VLNSAGNSIFLDALGDAAATGELTEVVKSVAVTGGGAATLAEVAQLDVPVAVAGGASTCGAGEQAEDVRLGGRGVYGVA
jgi:hypothetical protein